MRRHGLAPGPLRQSAARRRERHSGVGQRKLPAVTSLQKRTLKVELKIGAGTAALGKEPA